MTIASVAAAVVSVALLLVLTMIGQTIHAGPAFPLGTLLWVLLAMAADVAAVLFGSSPWAVFSLLPWLTALLLWSGRVRPLTIHVTDTALEVEEPPLQLPFASLQGLLAPRRPINPYKAGPRSYPIQVIHASGVLSIPAQLDVPSDELFSFLFRQFSPSGSRDLPLLADFLRCKERAFGTERVWSYRARAHLGRRQRHARLRAFFLAAMLSSGGWLAWGIGQRETGWLAGGIGGLIFGAVFWVALWLEDRRRDGRIRNWRQASLVIAPDGLALAQGDLVGELRWQEVREVKLHKGASSFQFTATNQPQRGIVLQVEGAIIVIADIYDRPLGLIHQNICHSWRSQTIDDDEGREALPRRSTEQNGAIASGMPLPPSSQGITPPD